MRWAQIYQNSLIIDGKFIADFFLQNDQEAVTCSWHFLPYCANPK